MAYRGGPLQNRLVVVWVENPDDSTCSIAVIQTDSDGRFDLGCKLSPPAQPGFRVARVNYGCETGGVLTDNTSFEVMLAPAPVVPEPPVMASVVLMFGALIVLFGAKHARCFRNCSTRKEEGSCK